MGCEDGVLVTKSVILNSSFRTKITYSALPIDLCYFNKRKPQASSLWVEIMELNGNKSVGLAS